MQLFNLEYHLKLLVTISAVGFHLVNAYPSYGYGNVERLQIEGTSRDVDETRFGNREYLDLTFRNQWTGRSHNNYRSKYGSSHYRPSYQPSLRTDDWDHVETKEPLNRSDDSADLMDDDVEMIDPGRASNQLAHLKFLPIKKRSEKSAWLRRNL